MLTQTRLNEISYAIIGAAIEVHRTMGPGFLESTYHECMEIELSDRGFTVQSEQWIPITYKGHRLRRKHRLDLLVENCLIVEVKAVETMKPLFEAQLLSYLRLTGKPKGLLINFNCELIKEHMVPLITKEFGKLPVR